MFEEKKVESWHFYAYFRQKLILAGCTILAVFAWLLIINPFAAQALTNDVPPPWTQTSIGYPQAGSATFSGGVYSVRGNGSTIGGTWDKFHYVSQPLNGNGEISARVVSFTTAAARGGTKYGLMIREDLTVWKAGKNVMVAFNPAGNIVFQYRTADGAATSNTTVSTGITLPTWLRLQRAANVFTAYTSPTGAAGSWTTAGSVTITMATNAQIGLAVTSGSDADFDVANFDKVKAPVTPSSLPIPWQSGNIGNPSVAGSADYANGIFTLNGNGSVIGAGWDKFHYMSQAFYGNGSLTARLISYTNSANRGGTRYGLMFRETLTPWVAGRNVTIALKPTDGGGGELVFQSRNSEGGGTTATTVLTVTNLPLWLKLERVGNVLTAYSSATGAAGSWTAAGNVTLNLPLNIYAGLVTNSGDDANVDTTTFDNVALTDSRVQAPWRTDDLGNPGKAGNAVNAAGKFTLLGSGAGIGSTADKFHYTSQLFTGDGAITAKLTAFNHAAPVTATGQYGLMLRENLAVSGNSRNVFVGLNSAGQLTISSRNTNGGATSVITAAATVTAPQWLKLERKGNLFTGYASATGAVGSWTTIGQVTLDLTASLNIGLALSSGDPSTLDSADFESVNVTIQSVSLSINWASSVNQTATRQSYGLNSFQNFNPQVAGNATYNANMTYMKPGLLRYHSWEMLNDSSQANGWLNKTAKTWDAQKIHNALSALTFTDTTIVMSIPGWPDWMDTNADDYLDADKFDDFAQFCADLVRIVNLDYPGHKVTFWEPTNERDDIYYVRYVNQGQPDRLNELIDIYNQAALAMRAVDPTIKVGGLAFARADLYPQVRRFVQAALISGTLDFLSYHSYASGDKNEPDEQIYNRAYNQTQPTVNSISKHTKDIRAILDELSPDRHIPLWLDEYNISWTWQNDDTRMRNYKGAIFDALILVGSVKEGADGTTAWNDKDGVYGKMDNSYKLNPAADVFHLFNNYMTGQRVASSQNVTASLVSMAVSDEGGSRKSFVLINRSPLTQTVTVSFTDWTPGSAIFDRYMVSVSGFTTATATLADLTGGLSLPANSVTVITVIDYLLVTKAADGGTQPSSDSSGTLSYALKRAKAGETIRFNLPSGGRTIAVNGQLAEVPAGVTLQGRSSCSDGQPNVVLDGSGAPSGTHGLELNGNNVLIGITVKGFDGWLIKNKGNDNKLWCTVADKK
jgi:hypothetical protein